MGQHVLQQLLPHPYFFGPEIYFSTPRLLSAILYSELSRSSDRRTFICSPCIPAFSV